MSAIDYHITQSHNEPTLKYAGEWHGVTKSIYSYANYLAGDRALTIDQIRNLPEPPIIEYNYINNEMPFTLSDIPKEAFFPKNIDYLNPKDHTFVFGFQHKTPTGELWCKVCFKTKDNKYALLSATNKYVKGCNLKRSIHPDWWVCKTSMISRAIFWKTLKTI
jgi:hypothetical protein